MKRKTLTLLPGLAALAALGIASCGSTYHASSGGSNTDDVYYTPRADGGSAPDNGSGNGSSNHSGSADYYEPNSSARESEPYNSDDYYDYAYSSRIKRFYSPVS